MIILIAVLVIVVLLILYVISTYNKLVHLRNTVQEAFSTMDVYLKKRWDLIPNLVETVKGYAQHESKTLEEIAKLRGSSYDSMSTDGKVDVNNKLTGQITKLLAVAENYPELKANTNFQQMQNDLSSIEQDIANSRKYYNGAVLQYNNKVQMIPSNIIAGMFGFKASTMFEAANEERENVKVQF